MQKDVNDRRARRSRRLLKEGLLALMQEKNFKDISAREITESADLNRGTFYLHYPDTQTLLDSIEDDIVAEAQALVDRYAPDPAGTSLAPFLLPLLDYVEEKQKTISLLLRSSPASTFLDKLHALIYRNSLDYARRRFAIRDEAQLAYFVSFASFGIMGMVREWADHGMTLSKEKLIAYADEMVARAAQAGF